MTRRVELRLDEHGTGSLFVDGVDIGPSVSGVRIEFDAGEPARVTLTLYPTNLRADLVAEVVAELLEPEVEP